MIRDELVRFRVITDKRGKITTGEKTEKGYPKSLDHFNVSKFPEVAQVYGNEPKEFIIFFPSDKFEDFFNDSFGCYGGNNVLKRRCDGVDCVHRINESLKLVEVGEDPDDPSAPLRMNDFGQGESGDCVCSRMPLNVPDNKGGEKRNPNRCSYAMYMAAWISAPKAKLPLNPLPYTFKTGSKANGDYIKSAIWHYKKFMGIPFRLWCESIKDVDKKFTRWFIEPYLTRENLLDYASEAMGPSRYELPAPPDPSPEERGAEAIGEPGAFNEKGNYVQNEDEKEPEPASLKGDAGGVLGFQGGVMSTFEQMKKKIDYMGITAKSVDELNNYWRDVKASIDVLTGQQRAELVKLAGAAKDSIKKRLDEDLPF